MSTTNKTQTETGTTGTGSTWQNGFTDSFRDLVSLQYRTAQAVMDKSMGIGQAVSDFYQNQLNESMKLSQEYAKYGWGLTESFKKTAVEFTDRAIRSFHN